MKDFNDGAIAPVTQQPAGAGAPHAIGPARREPLGLDGSWDGPVGRLAERRVVRTVVDAALAGSGAALVLCGDRGMGRSALLAEAANRTGLRVIAVVGTVAERDVPLGGVQQLQLGLRRSATWQTDERADATGGEPHRVALAMLDALSDGTPTLITVDDVHALDEPSVEALGVMARRTGGTATSIVLTVRGVQVPRHLAGLDALHLGPMTDADARALVARSKPERLADDVRDRLVAESAGRPASLLRAAPSIIDGGYGIGAPAAGWSGATRGCSADERLALVVAAADPTGDPRTYFTALEQLQLGADVVGQLDDAGLLQVGDHVMFADPVLRAAVYWDASPGERRRAHRAVADATDRGDAPERFAWHVALSCIGPDERVASLLEEHLQHARRRGGSPAVAAFLGRAAMLSGDGQSRRHRALRAASAAIAAGDLPDARHLLELADREPSGATEDVEPLLWARAELAATRRAEAADTLVAMAGRYSGMSGTRHEEVLGRAAEAVWDAGRFVTRTSAAGTDLSSTGPWTSGPRLMIVRAAADWDEERWDRLANDHVARARRNGDLVDLPWLLDDRACLHVLRGETERAAAAVAEATRIAGASGAPAPSGARLLLAAWRGGPGAAEHLSELAHRLTDRGAGRELSVAEYGLAVVANATGRYEDAVDAVTALVERDEPAVSAWALPELVEAASRLDAGPDVGDLVARFASQVETAPNAWASGLLHRMLAVTSPGDDVEGHFLRSIELLERTRLAPQLARTQLLYGEWLRRGKRRVDARAQLRAAGRTFERIGAVWFADRAASELRSTGERARKRSVESAVELTVREEQVARLASTGASNSDIAGQLFISVRTVEYHLHKVFAKLAITSRAQLATALGPVMADAAG